MPQPQTCPSPLLPALPRAGPDEHPAPQAPRQGCSPGTHWGLAFAHRCPAAHPTAQAPRQSFRDRRWTLHSVGLSAPWGPPRAGIRGQAHLAEALDQRVLLSAQPGTIAVGHRQVHLPAVAPDGGGMRGHPFRKQPGGTACQQGPPPLQPGALSSLNTGWTAVSGPSGHSRAPEGRSPQKPTTSPGSPGASQSQETWLLNSEDCLWVPSCDKRATVTKTFITEIPREGSTETLWTISATFLEIENYS